jgi:CMP/dCMP kinase
VIIAVDGPAGAGKSSVTNAIAKRMGLQRLDTGALYRAIALAADGAGMTIETEGLRAFVAMTDVQFRDGEVWLNGINVSEQIRTERVSGLASSFASSPAVRDGLLQLQRNVAAQGHHIVDGRDIGTVVFPNAEVKLFLTASVDARAQRRYLEYANRPDAPSLETIKARIESRDLADSKRAIAPLAKADDAIVVDSSEMDLATVVQHCIDVIEARLAQRGQT